MRRTGVSHLPLVDGANHVVEMVGLSDLLWQEELSVPAIVMAGGLGHAWVR